MCGTLVPIRAFIRIGIRASIRTGIHASIRMQVTEHERDAGIATQQIAHQEKDPEHAYAPASTHL